MHQPDQGWEQSLPFGIAQGMAHGLSSLLGTHNQAEGMEGDKSLASQD